MSAWYVTMTDKFMSGWGKARGRVNKLVFVCDSLEQALIVSANARARSDQKYISVTTGRRPWYSPERYMVQFKTVNDYPKWYQKGAF